MTKKVGIFGGSFNPPHLGHEAICRWLIAKKLVDEVWVIPCFIHPFGKELVSFGDRYEMCRLAFGKLGSKVLLSTVEKDLGGTSHTVKTIAHLKKQYPDYQFSLVTGGDIASQTSEWRDFDQIKMLVDIISIPRGSDSPIPDISATEVRRRLAKDEAIDDFISPEIAAYIDAHHLYR